MSINISDINTPADLARIQQDAEVNPNDSVVESIMDRIMTEDPAVGIDIVRHILVALREFHEAGYNHYADQGKTDLACVWVEDVTKLKSALDLIKDIQLWYPYGKPH